MVTIFGHEKIRKILGEKVTSGIGAQAYIFQGPRGVGKFLVAKDWAVQLVLGKGKDGSDPQDQVQSLIDIIVVRPEIEEKKGVIKEKEIAVEQIREAVGELAVFPSGGRYRVLIVDDADRMNLKAQNALLKTMEEPNSSSVIILITSRISKVVGTLRSRCQTVNFGLVDEKSLRSFIRSGQPGDEEEEKIIRYAMGRPALAAEMMEDPERIGWYRDSEGFYQTVSAGRVSGIIDLAGELSKNVPELMRHLEFWSWKDHMQGSRESLLRAEKYERILEIIRDTNANPRMTVERVFLE